MGHSKLVSHILESGFFGFSPFCHHVFSTQKTLDYFGIRFETVSRVLHLSQPFSRNHNLMSNMGCNPWGFEGLDLNP